MVIDSKVMANNKFAPVVRFAPSPTGHLHIGGLRTALFNYLFTRHNNGLFLLRIEDTDTERDRPEYVTSILDSFAWVGINSDRPVLVQSERLPAHKQLLDRLVHEKKAYRCYCTQEMVVARYNQAHPGDLFVKYDGLCRSLMGEPRTDISYVIRFALPYDCREVVFDDLICGRISFTSDQLDDFIIARSDGRPMYNFVVVADDAFMEVTHIIRAQEHLINTPKQILLYQAFGYSVPQFAHVPLILGPSGDKLSKRDGATSVIEYKNAGYLPEALLNYLARLGWAHGDQEIFSIEELINCFSLDHVGKKGAIFDSAKLQWLNGVYIRQKSAQYLYTYAIDNLASDIKEDLCLLRVVNQQQLFALIDLYKDRVATVKELMIMVVMVAKGVILFDEADKMKWITLHTPAHFTYVVDLFNEGAVFDAPFVKHVLQEVSQKNGLKLVQLAQPIRIALQGNSSGPGIVDLLVILGKNESIRRIQLLGKDIQKKEYV